MMSGDSCVIQIWRSLRKKGEKIMRQKEKHLHRMYSLSASLVVCWMLLFAPAIAKAQGTSVTKKDIIYTYDAENDSYTVTGHVARPDWETHTYTVLSSIDGKPVRKIGTEALACRYVILPDTVTELETDAFTGSIEIAGESSDPFCVIKEIRLGKGLKTLNRQLAGAVQMEKVTIPGNITRLEEHEFSYCSNLKEVRLEPGVTEIGQEAFLGCRYLGAVYIPSSVSYIAENAFPGIEHEMILHCVPGSYAYQYAVRHQMKYRFVYDVDQKLSDTKVQAKPISYKNIRVSWEKVSGADGYCIYRSTSGLDGTFRMVKKTKGSSLSYDDQTVFTGLQYFYRVRAYRTVGGENQIACTVSNTAFAKTKLSTTKFTKVSAGSNKSVTFTWQKADGATGYQIYRSTRKDSGYQRVLVTKKTTAVDKVSAKTTYYYKICAYRKIGTGKYAYSAFSQPKAVKF